MKSVIGRMKVTNKLFIITVLMFGIFIIGTLLIQSVFFERLYINKKRGDLASYTEKYKNEYNINNSDEKNFETTQEYEYNYNMKIIILDKYNRLKMISGPPGHKNDISKTRDLTEFIRQWSENEDNRTTLNKNRKTITFVVNTKIPDVKNVICISPDIKDSEIIFTLSSLQPVNEAVGVIEKLYLYFSIGAVLFTIILAFLYSNMIAKPLLKINKVASKMARLDFSEKCEVKSQDEIGNVAESLNFLSENLNSTLYELKNANIKLEEDIEKERKLERIRKDFVAAVSHELKTPISLIDGYAVGLKDEIFEGENKDYYLDVIIDEARKMGELVSDMLDLSQLESGSYKLIKEEFNLSELIRFTLKKFESLLKEKGIQLDINIMDYVKINADWMRIEQVLINFITNAFRHVNEKGTIFVSMKSHDDFISIEIENTGEHIPEDELPKLWDQFYKIDKSRNRRMGGTGIGLSIVKNILTLHGYTYGVENTDGGVKFFFTIPKIY